MNPTAGPGRETRSTAKVASRSTAEEARDLLALRHAKRGEPGAFAELLQANDHDLRAFVAALVGTDDLDAVMTQVYLRAFRGLPLAPATSPRLWLLRIADGAARDVARRAHQHAGAALPEAPIPLELEADERLVLAAIEAVGLTQRETARLGDGDLDRVRDLLEAGRGRPGVALPLEPAPPHGPKFWDELGRRLLVEQSAPAAEGRHRVTTKPTGVGDAEPVAPDAPTALAARGMARRVEQQNPRVIPWRRIGIALVLVVAVAGAVGIALTVAGEATKRDAGLGETAAKTLDQLDAALARNTVVRGTVRITAPGTDAVAPGTYRFVRSNAGSWQLAATDDSLVEGYDVASATATVVHRPGNGEPGSATRRTGLAPGPPEATGVARDSAGDVMGNVIRAVRGGSAGTVETIEVPEADSTSTEPGSTDSDSESDEATRSMWVVTSSLDDGVAPSVLSGTGNLGEVDADEAELVADRSLALPTELTLRRDGAEVLTVRFSDLTISQQPATSSYAPRVPTGMAVDASDAGFEIVATGDLTATGTRTAATPSYLPGGYVLSAAGVDAAGTTTVVCYRNGSRQLVLTTRPVPADTEGRISPFAPSGAGVDDDEFGDPDEHDVSTGLVAGSTAWSLSVPVRHVWARNDTSQVVAAGDPPIAQLVDVVASLR